MRNLRNDSKMTVPQLCRNAAHTTHFLDNEKKIVKTGNESRKEKTPHGTRNQI